jgi:hypothetical protein
MLMDGSKCMERRIIIYDFSVADQAAKGHMTPLNKKESSINHNCLVWQAAK